MVSYKPKLRTENSTTERIHLFPLAYVKKILVPQTAALNGRSGG